MPDAGCCAAPELIQRVVAPSEEQGDAWRRLIEPCRPLLGCMLRRFAGRAGGASWELDDLCQELYLHLSRDDWRRLRAYRVHPDAGFATWLAAVAYDLLLQRHRRKRPETVSVDQHSGPGGRSLAEVLAGADADVEDEVCRRELAREVQVALARLRHRRCQEVIRRHCYHEEHLSEIAAGLGLKASTVRQIYKRNKDELRRLLPPQLIEPS